MEGVSNIEEDIRVLKDMYPELMISVDFEAFDFKAPSSIPLTGKLPFDIHLQEDLKVVYGEEHIVLSKLSNNVLTFVIEQSKYPSLKNGIQLNILSPWMTTKDKNLLNKLLHMEFDEMTDESSDMYDPHTPIMMLIFGYLIDDVARSLFPTNLRICENEEEFKAFVNILDNLDIENKNRSNYHCCICMVTKKGEKVIELPCKKNHFLCIDCIKSYYGTMIMEGRMRSVRCPECKFHEIDLNSFNDYNEVKEAIFTPSIPFSFFNDILTVEQCIRYQDLFFSQAAIKFSKYSPFSCTTCKRCSMWVIKEDLDDPMMHCERCGFVFCFDCQHSWHGYNNSCGKKVTIPEDVLQQYAEYLDDKNMEGKSEIEAKYGKRILELAVKEFISERLLDLAISQEGSDLQRCPKCRTVVQRSEGCNRMKCGVCGILFCYLCGTALFVDDCYEHFRDIQSSCYGKLFEGMPGVDEDEN